MPINAPIKGCAVIPGCMGLHGERKKAKSRYACECRVAKFYGCHMEGLVNLLYHKKNGVVRFFPDHAKNAVSSVAD